MTLKENHLNELGLFDYFMVVLSIVIFLISLLFFQRDTAWDILMGLFGLLMFAFLWCMIYMNLMFKEQRIY